MLLRFSTIKTSPYTRALFKTSVSINKPSTYQLIKPKLMSTKSEAEWRIILTPEQFRVLRQKGKI
jgi:hypothetical protein